MKRKKPNLPKAAKRVFALARVLGVSLESLSSDSQDDVEYELKKSRWAKRPTKRTIRVVVHPKMLFRDVEATRAEFLRMATHELGHYIVAPEGRRRLKNYGHDMRSWSSDIQDVEEEKALLVGLYLLERFGMDPKYRLGRDRVLAKCKSVDAMAWWHERGKMYVDEYMAMVER